MLFGLGEFAGLDVHAASLTTWPKQALQLLPFLSGLALLALTFAGRREHHHPGEASVPITGTLQEPKGQNTGCVPGHCCGCDDLVRLSAHSEETEADIKYHICVGVLASWKRDLQEAVDG